MIRIQFALPDCMIVCKSKRATHVPLYQMHIVVVQPFSSLRIDVLEAIQKKHVKSRQLPSKSPPPEFELIRKIRSLSAFPPLFTNRDDFCDRVKNGWLFCFSRIKPVSTVAIGHVERTNSLSYLLRLCFDLILQGRDKGIPFADTIRPG